MSKTTDLINHPPHYKGMNGLETIDVIENFDLDFRLGNVIKYALRCGRKGVAPEGLVSNGIAAKIEDLSKARWYLDRVLSQAKRNHKDWLKLELECERRNRKFETRSRKR